MVVFGHAGDFGLPDIIDGGASHFGVLIFFALSGFLMGDLYLFAPPTRANILAYGVARISRIVPIYYVVILLGFCLHHIDPDFVWQITPVQLVRLLTFNGSVSVFWSIGPEIQFYVIFVGLWLLRARLNQDAVLAILVLGLAGLGLATIHHWPGVFVASKFHIFAGGVLAASCRRALAELPPAAIKAGHCVAFLLLLVFLIPDAAQRMFGATVFDRQLDPGFASFYGNLPRVLAAIFLVLAFSFRQRVAELLLANRLAVLIGRCSFSIYLLHVAVYYCATRLGLITGLTPWVGTLAVVLLTLIVSGLVHRFVEDPLHRVTRRTMMQRLKRSGTVVTRLA